MKKPTPHSIISALVYFLGSLCLLLCLFAPPASATVPSGLTLTGANLGTATGADSYNLGTDSFTVVGAGEGFWITNSDPDVDHFAYTTWSAGDVEIVARLVSFSGPTNAEAGLMVRQSNSSSVNRAATWFWNNNTAQGNLAFDSHGPLWAGRDYYYSMGGWASKLPLSPPYWLKLVRVGQNFAAYWSLNGSEWNPIGNTSGGALMGTGTFNVGLFVANWAAGTTSPATANFDNLYVGAPRLKYKTSWVGATSGGFADGWASQNITALWVPSSGSYDGTCYTNSTFDESSQCAKAYKDGKVAFAIPFGNTGLHEGIITGNSSNLFMATASPAKAVYRTDLNGTQASQVAVNFINPLGNVGGLAASTDRLFVSDITYGTVHIVDLTLTTPTEIGVIPAGVIAHPGPIAFDGTNFWITDCGADFPLTDHVTPTYTASIKCFAPTGGSCLRQINDANLKNPTALAIHPSATPARLYVCDSGPNQNIRYYTGLAGTPAYAGSFGVAGGIWNSTSPGTIYEAGIGGWQRFYNPTGVGFDSGGNIYVACNGGGTDLRKFDTSGNLVWKQLGLEGVACGDFDPGSDTIYTSEERFTMNYANTAPGSEWSYTAFTRNPLSSFAVNDARNPGGAGANGVQVRRLAGNNVFMYTCAMGGQPCMFYRFNNQGSSGQGSMATPYGWIVNDYSTNGFKLWIDANGDGLVTTGEEVSIPLFVGPFSSYDVDSNGDIWLAQPGYGSGITQLKCSGSQTIGSGSNTAAVPAYSATNYKNYLCSDPIRTIYSIKYDRAHDVMYCMGTKADGKWVLARYDNWLATGSTTPDDHPARYVTPLPEFTADITLLGYHPGPSDQYDVYMGMGFAGDKVFIADLWGPVRVYDANFGNPVIALYPGPEMSAISAWEDMRMGLNATKRSNGEYLVLEENDGWQGSIPLYRWTPSADTTVPGVATNLTATPQGRAIALNWTGPVGTVTSYNIYRGTTSGSLTLYQSNVLTASFVDANVTPGTTYYYTVAAVSTVGTGAQSNQASAVPASAQVEFVKYDTTTQGNWNPSGTRVYGTDGYYIPGPGSSNATDLVSAATYVSSIAHVNIDPTRQFFVTPDSLADTDPRALQKPTGTGRTSAIYTNGNAQNQQWHEITFSDTNWHQVSIYLMAWNYDPQYDSVEVMDLATGTVLDTRQPMDYRGGKWLVWNVRGSVSIRISKGLYYPTVSGIFLDPVQTTSAPTLGWWKLDDTSNTPTPPIATDSSGAGNNGTKNGGTWTAGAHPTPAGFYGCVTFGGTNATSLLALPFNPTGSAKLTFSMWFKTSTSGILFGMNAPGNPSPAFAPVLYVGTDSKLHGAFYTGVIQNMISSASVNDNQWHHAALTSDGSLQTLYLDGEIVGMLSAPTPSLSCAWYYFQAGLSYVTGWPNTTGTLAYFTGQVDDLRLYNRVLSNSEIWKLKN